MASGVEILRERFGEQPFRVSEAVAAGVSRTALHRLREAGELVAVGRGVVQLPGAGMGMSSGLAVVSARVPRGAICLNSALAFWDLSDEVPERIHVAVPRGAHRPSIAEPATQVHVFDARTFDVEREQQRTDADEMFWIYSAERSVVDAMRMSRWVGRDVALHALRRYMDRGDAKPARLAEIAREIGGSSQLRPALEALLS
ncbi:MAG TPA: type IV toxin-antitoxin system AbiEi family antitoxin domain-containing protein [Baekduia sp.]|uniref:type IV toxin-antitoxin system AbiEi family antitoxin domain-containing protein n=1 Tax=Baekduia sp. TaxID=2600305 RepID=UPI002BFC2923|nr:type IV toxin-antitoxin system AbiEi family antitoxin domain-containing protein [Baekduia sp.]HMJ34330.1 type IV toxin-antitoxin system AbiEi family antitoxin domain-containing protein [Baekduia sp.]